MELTVTGEIGIPIIGLEVYPAIEGTNLTAVCYAIPVANTSKSLESLLNLAVAEKLAFPLAMP